MKFILNKDTFKKVDEENLNSGSINYYEADIEYDETWNDLTIVAIIQNADDDKAVATSVINNKLYIDKKISNKYFIGFIGFKLSYELTGDTAINPQKKYYTRSGEEGSYVYTLVEEPVLEDISTYYEATKTYQISTKMDRIKYNKGAGEIPLKEEDLPRIDAWEIYIEQIQSMINEIKELPSYDITDEDIANWNNKVTDDDYVHTDNNFTDEEKEKLAGLENYDETELRQRVTNAEDDIDDLETTVAGHTTQIGEIEAEIPTKVSDLNNDSNFQTGTEVAEAIGEHNQSNTSHTDIRQLISNLQSNKQDNLTAGSNITIVNDVISATPGLRFEVVQTLPATGDSNVIYLVPNSGTTPNIYDEYIYVNNTFELIGTTEIDLSNYVQKSDMPYVDLSNYSIGDVISDTEIVTNLKNKRVLVKYNASYYRLAIINSTNSYIYTTMNNTTSGDYIVLYEDNNTLTFLVADTTEWEVTVNKVTSVSSSSTDTEYPSAKAVYDYIESLDIEEVDF